MKKKASVCFLSCFLCLLLLASLFREEFRPFVVPSFYPARFNDTLYKPYIKRDSKETHENVTSSAAPSGTYFQMLWYAKQPYFSGNVDLQRINCTYSNCKLSDDKNLLRKSDVVLFAYRDMYNNVPIKKDGQIWVIVNIESPAHDSDLSSVWDNKFDWSMTYRQDSEVLLSYKTFRREVPLEKDYHAIYRNKTGFAAWAVSNCHSTSRRDEFVRQLQKYIKIDIYGRCGHFSCPGSMPECHERLSQKYKFYLGLENSFCKDYVTEKVFHTFLDNSNAIYVSRGAPNVAEILPPNTFIDAFDFNSTRSLANYLIELGADEERYISYLKEIDKYHIDNERNYHRSICDLCELINTYKSRNISWTGRNFNSWFRENMCNYDIPI